MSASRSRFDDPSELEALRGAWARADDRDAVGGTTRAPADRADPDRVWQAVAGELDPEALRALAEAAGRDPELARSWRLARELHAAGAGAAASGARVRWLPSASPVRWLATAALLLVGLGVGLWLRPTSLEPGGSAWRGGAIQEVRPSTPEGAVLPRREFVLRWVAVAAPEARYTLRVTTARLELVAEVTGLVAPEHRLAARDLAGLPAGTELFWQVDALLADGRTVSSPAVAVRLAD